MLAFALVTVPQPLFHSLHGFMLLVLEPIDTLMPFLFSSFSHVLTAMPLPSHPKPLKRLTHKSAELRHLLRVLRVKPEWAD